MITKGEWKVARGTLRRWQVYVDKQTHIVTVPNEANAHLIAAAPDYHAATALYLKGAIGIDAFTILLTTIQAKAES